jgi:hypothetical protein
MLALDGRLDRIERRLQFLGVLFPAACGGVVHFLKIYRRKSEASKDI